MISSRPLNRSVHRSRSRWLGGGPFQILIFLWLGFQGLTFCQDGDGTVRVRWRRNGASRSGSRGSRCALKALTAQQISELKVPELRAALRQMGLEDSGVRRTLVERLLVAATKGESESETSTTTKDLPSETLKPNQQAEVLFVVNASVGHMARVVGRFEDDGSGTEYFLVLGDFTGRSAGLDLKGQELWVSSSGLDSISNTVLSANRVLCASGWTGNVSSFAGGQVHWTTDAGVGEYARVACAENLGIYAGGGSVHKVAGVDLETGVTRYCVDSGVGAVWSVSAESNLILCGGSWARPEHTASIAVLDARSGEQQFVVDPRVGRYIVTAVAPDGGVAYCAGENGMVGAFDSKTGDVLWHVNSSMEEVWNLELHNDLLLCSGGWSEQLSALDRYTGQLRWGPVNATVGKVFSCTVSSSWLFCGGSTGLVVGLDVNSGELRFTANVSKLGEIWSIAYDDKKRLLFCGGNREHVAAIQL